MATSNDDKREPDWLRIPEAQAFRLALGEQPTGWVLDRLIVLLRKKWKSAGERPKCDLDVRFLFELVAELVQNADEMSRILGGENVGVWHPEDR
jgi:hypothetical protein